MRNGVLGMWANALRDYRRSLGEAFNRSRQSRITSYLASCPEKLGEKWRKSLNNQGFSGIWILWNLAIPLNVAPT